MSERETWGEGPWEKEGDHDVWVDPATDLDCMINRGPSGALCAYVGVPPTHPWHGKKYTHVDHLIEVHGGLTYSDACQEGGEVCHTPAEGREHDIWWFGFDCAHFSDYAPAMETAMKELVARRPELAEIDDRADKLGIFTKVYRDWAYVQGECRSLAAQLIAVES